MELTLEQQKANRKLWVEALRSGKYEQGTDVLKGLDGKMCCLGVLCEIMGLAWEEDETAYRIGGYSTVAPPEAMAFVGLADDSGWYAARDTSLAVRNDDGASFSEIADIIESEPPGLFVEP